MHTIQFIKDLRIDDNPNIHEFRFVAAEARSGLNLFLTSAVSKVNKANYTVYINNRKTTQQLDAITFAANDEVAIVADKTIYFPQLVNHGGTTCYRKIKSPLPIMTYDGVNFATSLMYIFGDATNLIEIPENLLANIPNPAGITAFTGNFQNCTSLTTIPENLFACVPELNNFTHMFSLCTALTSIPPKLFDNTIVIDNVGNTFYKCSNITGPLPALWTRSVRYYTYCFKGCTKASNYAAAQAAGWA